jgi:Putative phage serine protease XkdF
VNWALTIPVIKSDVERQLVTGWASVSTDASGAPVVDSQGDMIPIEELERAAHEVFASGGKNKGGDNHVRTGVADIVESMVIDTAKREALGFGPGATGWVVTLKVHDVGLWEQIKRGEKLELSIHGTAERMAS